MQSARTVLLILVKFVLKVLRRKIHQTMKKHIFGGATAVAKIAEYGPREKKQIFEPLHEICLEFVPGAMAQN